MFPVISSGISGGQALAELFSQIFNTGAARAAAPTNAARPGALPPPSALPAQVAAAPAGATADDGTPLPPQRPPGIGIGMADAFGGARAGNGPQLPFAGSSTPDASNASTAQGYTARQQPAGNLLHRLQAPTPSDPTGAGAIKAIEMAKGKSKWGAVASGLAAGMAAQDAANRQNQTALGDFLAKQFGREKDMETLRRQGDLSGAQAEYYRSLAVRGGADTTRRGGATAGSTRTIMPEERAYRASRAEQQIRNNAMQRGLSGDALEREVQRQKQLFGLESAGPAPAPTASAPANMPAPNPVPSRGRAAPGSPLDKARAAIAAGAPRDKVLERLRQNGIEPPDDF